MITLAIRSFTKRCSCNEKYFKVWSPSMAYWLGMYFADGYVSSDKKRAGLQLKCTDMKHIHKLKNTLLSTYAIGVYPLKKSKYCGATHVVCNPTIISDLIDLGCIPRKTFTLQWPARLPNEFANHFVRGYFDGDGCVNYEKVTKSMAVTFAGTRIFLKNMQECINNNAKQKANGCLHEQETIWILRYAGNKSVPTVLDWMYEGSEENNRLDRKYALFQKLKCIISLPTHGRLEAYTNYRESYEWTQFTTCNYDKCKRNKPPIE